MAGGADCGSEALRDSVSVTACPDVRGDLRAAVTMVNTLDRRLAAGALLSNQISSLSRLCPPGVARALIRDTPVTSLDDVYRRDRDGAYGSRSQDGERAHRGK